MSSGVEAESAKNVKVGELTLDSRRVNVTAKVVSKSPIRETVSRTDGSAHRVSDALVGDETGAIYLTLWDDNIDKATDGAVISVKNGYVNLFRGSMRLNVGRYGSLESSQETVGEVNSANNLSDKKYEEERRYPSFRPIRGEGGYGGGYGERRGGFRGSRPRRRY